MEDKPESTNSIGWRIIKAIIPFFIAYQSFEKANNNVGYTDHYFIASGIFLIGLCQGFPSIFSNLYSEILLHTLTAYLVFAYAARQSWPISSMLILGYLMLACCVLWYRRKKLSVAVKSKD